MAAMTTYFLAANLVSATTPTMMPTMEPTAETTSTVCTSMPDRCNGCCEDPAAWNSDGSWRGGYLSCSDCDSYVDAGCACQGDMCDYIPEFVQNACPGFFENTDGWNPDGSWKGLPQGAGSYCNTYVSAGCWLQGETICDHKPSWVDEACGDCCFEGWEESESCSSCVPYTSCQEALCNATDSPTAQSTQEPTQEPTADPTESPTAEPVPSPTAEPGGSPNLGNEDEPKDSSIPIPVLIGSIVGLLVLLCLGFLILRGCKKGNENPEDFQAGTTRHEIICMNSLGKNGTLERGNTNPGTHV